LYFNYTSIWRPIKSRKKPQTLHPPIRANTNPPSPWAKSDTEKTNVFARHLTKVYKPHNAMPDPEITRKLTSRPPSSETLQPFTTGELQGVVKHLHPHKAPGLDQITTLMIRKLPQGGIKAILHLLNTITRLGYWPRSLKRARVIMILKPGKDPTDVTSYRPISLLPVLSKILEKLLLSRITKELPPQTRIPSHQFGFRKGHSTIQQCHWLTDTILKAFEERKYCPAVFLDISQAFDKVWHPGLLLKIKQTLPYKYFTLLQSSLQHRYLEVSYKNAISPPILMQSGVPQGSILGPFLYTLYTADIPITTKTTLSTYTDDTAITTTHLNPTVTSRYLQAHLQKIELWTRKWRLKINETKSAHITFTLRKDSCPPLHINQTIILQTDMVKYLGLHFDKRLTWREHVTKTRKQLDLKTRELLWLIGKRSPLSLTNKLLIYKTVLKPIWTYGLALWGCAASSNLAKIQR